ncbi:MAG: SpoIID/LytB domain-containing protein [Thermodesulfovibrionia bacterium]|nr:SpoIID/LytB domain-containing protein [Thermodesulfovibrionia bacterium]
MKRFPYFIFLILICLSAQSVRGEDIIKVLIVEDPHAPLLSENAEKLGSLKGDLFMNGHIYSGFLDVRKDKNGLHFINELPFDDYVEGVIAAELEEDWAMEALKAQAVISRTYALFMRNQNTGKDYHITSSLPHQVYKGDTTSEKIHQAVKETAGEILTYRGQPIKAFYHSTCKGTTELPEEVWMESYPYLRSVPCRGENSPYEYWGRRFDIEEIEKALGIKGLNDIHITSLTSTGRVKTVTLSTEDSELEVHAADLRKLIGYEELPSTHFTVSIVGREVIFQGSGNGHAVGLSQWGALEMAQGGSMYKEILKHYYPETVLQKQ